MPPNGALHGGALDHLMEVNLAWLGGIFVLAHVLLIVALLPRRRRALSIHSLLRLEAAGVAGLSLLYAAFGVMAQHVWAADRFEGAAPTALQVEVVGVQFQWYFRYPGQDAAFGSTRPQLVEAAMGNPLGLDPADARGSDDLVSSVLVLPAGREVDLRLRAHDVMHGFFVPGMRLKQNAVPGMVLHVHFTPERAGEYPILCTQVCGSGHARMQAVLRVVPPVQYDRWLAARTHRRF